MVTPHNHSMRTGFILGCVLFGILASGVITPASAQVVLPLLEPTPSSTLTSSTAKFVGGLGGQPGEQHWLTVGIRNWDRSIFHQSLGTGNTATVSGLIPTGTLFVRYFTYTPSTGWQSELYTYQMNVQSGGPRVWNCAAGDTDCLINAITIANGSGNPEIIRLEQGTYTITSFHTGDSLLPPIIGHITIEGFDSRGTFIQSKNLPPRFGPLAVKTFDVDEVGTLVLSALSIRKGGTAILNRGNVTMRDVMITDNQLVNADGQPQYSIAHGIYNLQSGTSTIQDSTIADYFTGVSASSSGAIRNEGTMNISGTSIKRNDGDGIGGIHNSATGIMTIKTSTITDNTASNNGIGGIRNEGKMELHNTLVQSNIGAESGGLLNSGEMSITKSVFTGNEGGTGSTAGGIHNSGQMTISKSVIAFNKTFAGAGIFNVRDLFLEHTVIFNNKAESDGGAGIKNVRNGRLTLTETLVTDNTPANCVGCP